MKHNYCPKCGGLVMNDKVFGQRCPRCGWKLAIDGNLHVVNDDESKSKRHKKPDTLPPSYSYDVHKASALEPEAVTSSSKETLACQSKPTPTLEPVTRVSTSAEARPAPSAREPKHVRIEAAKRVLEQVEHNQPTRGGARKGAGRKRQKLIIPIQQGLLEALEAYAAREHMTREQAAVQIISRAVM